VSLSSYSVSYFINPELNLDFVKSNQLKKASNYLKKNYLDYELFVVLDNSFHSKIIEIKNHINKYPNVRLLIIENGTNDQNLYQLLFKCSIGDFLIIHDSAIPNLKKINPLLIDMANNNIQLSIGIGECTKLSFFYSITRKLFKKFLNSLDYFLPENTTYFRVFSRSLMNFLNENNPMQIKSLFFMDAVSKIFFSYKVSDPYKYKRTFFSSLKKLSKLLSNNQFKLINLVFQLGVLGCISSIGFSIYTIISYFLKDNIIEGWSSLLLVISFLFMILFLMLYLLSNGLISASTNQHKGVDLFLIDEYRSNYYFDSRINVTSNEK
jgi:polyisoprenyl-phosphate glycosyltransferase